MFLHPWAIAVGLAAAGLPIVIHLLTRPRPVPLPLSTLRFVREVLRQRRARHRLRDFLILAARTLAVLLVAAAIARPRIGEQPAVAESEAGSAVRVVVLDASQSMAAAYGAEAMERARTVAASYLRYRPGLRANLIVAGASPRAVFPEPSHNLDALRRELAGVRALPERLDVHRAMGLAAEMLSASTPSRGRRELVVVSDFQRTNWARVDFSAVPLDTRIQLETVSPNETPPNLAVLHAGVRGRVARGATTHLEVEVGNFSSKPRPVTVEVTLGDAAYRLDGTCAPGRRTTLSQEIAWQQLGWLSGQARLVDIVDALAADNARPLAVEVHGKPRYVLITRQPPSERPSSSHFLDCALVPDAAWGEQASARILRLDPEQVDRQSLVDADLIVLDHPGKLAAPTVHLLAGLLRRGRSALYVACEPIDAANLRALVDSLGTALRLPVEFLPPPDIQRRHELFLTSVRLDAAPFHVFGENTTAITGPLRFSGGLNTRKLPDALEDDLLATFNDGTACLVVSASDAGSLAVLNADLAGSNFPKTEAFVPFIEELVLRLLSPAGSAREFVCGETLLVRLPADAGSGDELTIAGPPGAGGGGDLGALSGEATGAVWHWPAPDRVGVYRVDRAGSTVYAVPLTIAREESQLESLPMETLKTRLALGRAIHVRSGGAEQRHDDLWTWLLVACVGCILAELLMLLWFRS